MHDIKSTTKKVEVLIEFKVIKCYKVEDLFALTFQGENLLVAVHWCVAST